MVINTRNKGNEATALHIATEGGYRDLVKALLQAGASANDETKQGNTPVHIAARNGYVQLLNDFAQHGVNMRMVRMFRNQNHSLYYCYVTEFGFDEGTILKTQ